MCAEDQFKVNQRLTLNYGVRNQLLGLTTAVTEASRTSIGGPTRSFCPKPA